MICADILFFYGDPRHCDKGLGEEKEREESLVKRAGNQS
jgi:hypothetical protein